MGVDGLTYFLGVLILFSGAANVFLGEGWASRVLDKQPFGLENNLELHRFTTPVDPSKLPKDYAPPSVEDMLRKIPKDELDWIINGGL